MAEIKPDDVEDIQKGVSKGLKKGYLIIFGVIFVVLIVLMITILLLFLKIMFRSYIWMMKDLEHASDIKWLRKRKKHDRRKERIKNREES